MCGICGIIHFDGKPVDSQDIKQMMAAIKHRGPDDEGYFIDKHTGLGNVRLSILDLSAAGRQPMFSQDKRYCLVYNGEVYNYLELREELQGKYQFKTKTDTEIVLNAFSEWGPDCLKRFNGMFAFAIYDTLTEELFMARDRFGIKPFYYYRDDSIFAFASEQRALLPFLKDKQPDRRAIYEYLLYSRTDQGDYTFFAGIRKLPHGSCAWLKNCRWESRKWYCLANSLQESFKDPGEFYDTLKQSIGLQLRSDVPVGVCLSGGLDSSSIVSLLLKEFNKTDLNTFSAVYEKEFKEGESQYIAEYSHALRNMFFTRPTAETLFNDLDCFVACHSEPVATLGPYAQYKVMELARDHVKVTLDGQGADEQLAGYHYFFGGYFKQLLLDFHWARLAGEVFAYTRKYKSLYAFKYLTLYLLPGQYKDSLSRQAHLHITAEFFREGKKISTIGKALYNPRTLKESLTQHFEYKLEHLLKWEDHNSMAHSIESRVPFLDHNLVERTVSLPSDKILNKATTKFILREALKGTLPEKIRTRGDKIGFATPWDRWFRSESMRKLILEILESVGFRHRGYLDPGKCLTDYRAHLAGKKNLAKEIWKWLNLELWLRKFFD